MSNNIATKEMGVRCELDGVYVHSIAKHLKDNHPDVSLDVYKVSYPDAPLLSQRAQDALAKRRKKNLEEIVIHNCHAADNVVTLPGATEKRPMFEVFDIPEDKTLSARGTPIQVTTFGKHDPEKAMYVPDVDKRYIFPIENLRYVIVGLELNSPLLIWGMHGTGKTTLIEQACARANRPWFRVQHTSSTEEADVVGQYVVKNGATEFELGPLPYAMLNGLTYVADEYDYALPSVISLYQAVLEGKPLVIKEAPPEFRVIRPDPNFRFVATGNTNGAGDDTGLYQGTTMQNAAAYSRFQITLKMDYMPRDQEVSVLMSQAQLAKQDAETMVEIATEVRRLFEEKQIDTTISPRELITAGKLACLFGKTPQLHKGLELAFMNRLNSTDQRAVSDYVKKHVAE